jgi:predicted transcriptional regulator
MDNDETTNAKLDMIIDLLRNQLAIQLAARGISRGDIAKRLHVATATVVKMLEGIKPTKNETET